MSARIQRHLNHCPEWDVRKYYQPFYHFISRINRKEINEIRKAISIQYIGDAYVMYAHLLSDCLPIPQD